MTLNAQSNSPLSRFGLGDQFPKSPVLNRGMGGISAASNDYYNINYSNPASYAFFYSVNEDKSRKLSYGRAILNIGVSNEGRTIIDPKLQKRFNSNNIIFSNVGIGLPLRKNWGMALGLRPMNAIDYKLVDDQPIKSASTGQIIDNGQTLYEGTGGVYLAALGTGVKIKTGKFSYFSVGANGGYMFGKKEYTSRRTLYNDSTLYANGFQQTKTGIGGLYFDAGMQYQFKMGKKTYMGLGISGNWKQNINASRDLMAGTYSYDANTGYIVRDTVLKAVNQKGTIIYPSGITAGFIVQKPQGLNEPGWLIGADITRTNWDDYRFYGAADKNIRSDWKAKVGAELRPAPKNNYFSNVAYRFGFFSGPDYVYTNKQLPSYGLTMGLGLPLANYNPQAKGQASQINLAFEYIKRGNDNTLLKENLFRISVGFSLTDYWFVKRRYD